MEQTKRFLWAFVAVTALMLAIVPAINLRTDYSRVLHRDFEENYGSETENLVFLKACYLLQESHGVTGLIFGSSRVQFGFDTADIDRALGGHWYKMAYPGGSPYQHYTYLRFLIDHGFVPDDVLLTIDDFDLWKRMYAVNAKKNYNRRVIPDGARETAEFCWFYIFKMPGEHELDILKGNLSLVPSDRVLRGDRGRPIPADEDSLDHMTMLSKLPAYQRDMGNRRYYYQESLEYIRSFVELCQTKDIGLRIAYLPSPPKTLLMRNHDDIRAFKVELAPIHSFYDFMGIYPITMNPSNWVEMSHFRTPVGRAIVQAMAVIDTRSGHFGTLVTRENVRNHGRLVGRTIQDRLPVLQRSYGRHSVSQSLQNRRQKQKRKKG